MARWQLGVGIGGHAALAAVAVWLFAGGCPTPAVERSDRWSTTALPHGLDALRPLQAPLAPPGPHDWLAHHREDGQTYEQWRASDPVRATGERGTLYILPLGGFTVTQRRIVELSAEFMRRYFARPVRFLPDVPLDAIPASARRVNGWSGDEQILTGHVLDHVLRPALPADACAVIAFTATDLWPGDGWNFVFGQASLRHRVGVWSIARNGDPDGGDEAFRLCLLRTLKTATHETGHMLSMHHCIAYECNLCGCNHREEADRRPLACCPECVAKICDACGVAPIPRYRALLEFCREHRLDGAARDYARFLAALTGE